MGLSSTIANASKAAVKATGDLRKTVTYRHVENDYYDTESGTRKDRLEDYVLNTQAIITSFKGEEAKGEHILREDQKVIFLQADLPITPKVKDFLIIASVKWFVVDFKADPADALWILQVRKS